eukprot:CAMPEP_0119362828 /NCGR_PEP_ID=MMETSP1334-20130426/9759_1 /TAXON_ID=127549 /ORGANISM="Calcidiscus leptoporus, Strain RCC1130" /LENGTH=97 /DNA_ID=CAMNT_0007378089 /DNA_START=415 /DNA_END=705 /DNA_ORIENTATION=+
MAYGGGDMPRQTTSPRAKSHRSVVRIPGDATLACKLASWALLQQARALWARRVGPSQPPPRPRLTFTTFSRRLVKRCAILVALHHVCLLTIHGRQDN